MNDVASDELHNGACASVFIYFTYHLYKQTQNNKLVLKERFTNVKIGDSLIDTSVAPNIFQGAYGINLK